MEDNKEAFGLPISGDVNYYNDNVTVEQWPIERLQPYISAMLQDEDVVKFGWVQYTPYFNDGEACNFGIHGVFAVTTDTQAKTKEYEFFGEEEFNRWDHEIRSYAYGDSPKSPEHHIQFMEQIESGHYHQALEKTFGDPAVVTITREGIDLEYYSHD